MALVKLGTSAIDTDTIARIVDNKHNQDSTTYSKDSVTVYFKQDGGDKRDQSIFYGPDATALRQYAAALPSITAAKAP